VAPAAARHQAQRQQPQQQPADGAYLPGNGPGRILSGKQHMALCAYAKHCAVSTAIDLKLSYDAGDVLVFHHLLTSRWLHLDRQALCKTALV